MRSTQQSLGVVLAGFIFTTVLAWSSITGSISGVVTDPSGAVIPGANVVATNAQTGVKAYTRTGLVIDANSALRADAALSVGTINEKVEVSTEAAHVETESTQMGEVISGKTMTAVPLNGRAFTDLLALQPGVSPYNSIDTGM